MNLEPGTLSDLELSVSTIGPMCLPQWGLGTGEVKVQSAVTQKMTKNKQVIFYTIL